MYSLNVSVLPIKRFFKQVRHIDEIKQRYEIPQSNEWRKNMRKTGRNGAYIRIGLICSFPPFFSADDIKCEP